MGLFQESNSAVLIFVHSCINIKVLIAVALERFSILYYKNHFGKTLNIFDHLFSQMNFKLDKFSFLKEIYEGFHWDYTDQMILGNPHIVFPLKVHNIFIQVVFISHSKFFHTSPSVWGFLTGYFVNFNAVVVETL